MRYQDARQNRASKRGYHTVSVSDLGRCRYVVQDPDGKQIGAPTTKDMAEDRAGRLQAESDARAKRGLRPCLCCGRPFESEGIHNRMCGPCRGQSDALAAYGYSGAGAGRKPRKSAGS